MTKPAVLCIDRFALAEQNIPMEANGIYPFDLNKVNTEDYQFINRKVCDDKNEHTFNHSVGYRFPQILPYIAIMDNEGKYLTYSRNGTETRLHGSRSIGIGGHIDIYDFYDENYHLFNSPIETIAQATHRELQEEIGVSAMFDTTLLSRIIVDTTNSVGKVHVGLTTTLIAEQRGIHPQEELHDPQWLTVEELKANIDQYENWSKLIIGEL